MKKIGILGGGQLGRMLLQAAANYPVETFVLENDASCPAAHLCDHFICGDISSFDDVYNFGKLLDAVTIEIEAVNEEALECLEKEGVKVYPKPSALKVIKNKILQKEFYKKNQIPTADFGVTQHVEDLQNFPGLFPGVHKIAVGGYDGRGVVSLKSLSELTKGFDLPAVLEKKIDIVKEIAITIAANEKNELAIYPAVHMIFNPALNLLDFQFSPAELSDKILWKAEAIALQVVKHLHSPGIFAIEIFVDHENQVWVNETAPRVHNSGHHTIEASYCSQFDMLWRIMLDFPLGNTKPVMPAAMVNIVGEANCHGIALYEGLSEVLKLDNAFVHIYGKKETRPGRKMGHVTVLSNEKQELLHTAVKIKNMLKVTASPAVQS